MSEYLTVPETLAMTGLPRSTYYEWRLAGRFPAVVRIGLASKMHRRADVEAWIAKRNKGQL